MVNNFTRIKNCRISGSSNLVSVLNLGEQYLTGVFPKQTEQFLTKGPLELLWCPDSGLLQLAHSYDSNEMYGENYGYRSGLNNSMVKHLQNKNRQLQRKRPVSFGELVLDIGSNDGTLLSAYQVEGLVRVGIDPTGSKFREFYQDGIDLVPDFFSASIFELKYKNKKASIITSIAMFYDLEDPSSFVADIAKVLDLNGIWHFEQSYMPSMLRTNSYDTVCHEHVEYYSLGVIKSIIENQGLKIIDVEMNGVNGGSIAVTVAHEHSDLKPNHALINWLLDQEYRMGLNTLKPYRDFEERVFKHREDFVRLVKTLNEDGKRVVGYGASTKGNVLLQFCGLKEEDISCIAEVNPEKFGSFTPGSLIPILSETEVRAMKPDYMIVLPWHFKESIINREADYLQSGGKLIFPFPEIEII